MPPVSAISGTIGPSFAANVRLIARAHLGRSGENDAGDVAMRGQRRADCAVAGHELQRRGRDTRFMQQPDRLGRDQRCLFGGFRDGRYCRRRGAAVT